jgi:protein phosphatase
MGTTLAAVLAVDGGLALANVGDSRVYVLEGGDLRQLTEDQTWINEVGRKLKIDEETLRRHPYRHILTQALGVSDRLKVAMGAVSPASGNQVVISSDGLHGVVEPEQMTAILSSGRKLADRCHSLVDAAKRAGGPDNITVVLLEF